MTFERADTPGVLDSDAFQEGKPLSSKVLRELARTGNHLQDAGSVMLTHSWLPDSDGITLLAPETFKTVYEWELPSRPIHTKAEIRLRAAVEDNTTVRWRFETDSGASTVTQVGTGASGLTTAVVSLPSREYTRFRIRVEAGDSSSASTVDIGSPNSWLTGSRSTLLSLTSISTTTTTWDFGELANGDYTVDVVDDSLRILMRRKIRTVSNLSDTYDQITFDPLTEEELNAIGQGIVPSGRTVTIRKAPAFELRNIIIRGIP